MDDRVSCEGEVVQMCVKCVLEVVVDFLVVGERRYVHSPMNAHSVNTFGGN